MNDFIERIDERRRQRELLAGANSAAAAAASGGGLPHPHSGLLLTSDGSRFSNASETTAASLRQKARLLQEEALLHRDKASCVRGSQQSFRVRVAELRETEAARLVALAEAAETAEGDRSCRSSNSSHKPRASRERLLSPESSDDAALVGSSRGAADAGASDETASFYAAEHTLPPPSAPFKQGTESRIEELLSAAAERRDKASCVRGGKQRALLAMASRIEAEAEALAVSFRQQQQRQQEQQIHRAASSGSTTPASAAGPRSYRDGSVSEHFASQLDGEGRPTRRLYASAFERHQHEGALQPQQSFGSSDSSRLLSGDSNAHELSRMRPPAGQTQTRLYPLESIDELRQQQLQQQQMQQQQQHGHLPQEDDWGGLHPKRRAASSSVSSQADQTLVDDAERLRQDALLCRDKALCCSGSKQRQLIGLAELKERRAADIFAKVGVAAPTTPLYSAQQQQQQLYPQMNSSRLQQQQQQQQLLLGQRSTQLRAAGELRGRVDPRGESDIFGARNG